MPTEIIKVAPDQDLYMAWSSVVEAPVAIGTYHDMLHDRELASSPPVSHRLARADERGTSALWEGACTWDHPGRVYQQQGFLPRSRFAEFAERWQALPPDAIDPPDVSDLLEPFE